MSINQLNQILLNYQNIKYSFSEYDYTLLSSSRNPELLKGVSAVTGVSYPSYYFILT